MQRSSAPDPKPSARPSWPQNKPLASHVLFAGCLAGIASLASCNDGSGGSGYKDSCKQTCERAHDCLSTVDAETCADDCIDELKEVGDHLRSDYVKGIDECFEALSCDQLIAATTSNACRDEASARLAPSPTAVSLCEAVSESLKECIGLTTGTAECLENVKIFNDSSLRSALTCKERPCTERFSCLQEKLGIALTP